MACTQVICAESKQNRSCRSKRNLSSETGPQSCQHAHARRRTEDTIRAHSGDDGGSGSGSDDDDARYNTVFQMFE